MLGKNDWRLMAQEKYLMNVQLMKSKYTRWSEKWDRDHCEFCSDTFSEYDGDLCEGHCTLDRRLWMCLESYEDFQEMFNWALVDENEKE